MGSVHEYEEGLARQLYEELSEVPGIRILGPPPDVPEVGSEAAAGWLQHSGSMAALPHLFLFCLLQQGCALVPTWLCRCAAPLASARPNSSLCCLRQTWRAGPRLAVHLS